MQDHVAVPATGISQWNIAEASTNGVNAARPNDLTVIDRFESDRREPEVFVDRSIAEVDRQSKRVPDRSSVDPVSKCGGGDRQIPRRCLIIRRQLMGPLVESERILPGAAILVNQSDVVQRIGSGDLQLERRKVLAEGAIAISRIVQGHALLVKAVGFRPSRILAHDQYELRTGACSRQIILGSILFLAA